jgi:Tol biopolymer transport system component
MLDARMMRWFPLVLTISVLFAACGEENAPTESNSSGSQMQRAKTGSIAFLTNRTGNDEIFSMDAAGKHPVNLTKDLAPDAAPARSYDGLKIAYSHEGDIFTMNADGSAKTRITHSEAVDDHPTWSPDGSKIAFLRSTAPSFGLVMYVVNSDGSNEVQITHPEPSEDESPTWSPDGQKIAFVRGMGSGSGPFVGDIYTVNPDGSALTNVTNSPAPYDVVSWSPNGSQLAFSGFLPGYESNSDEIFVMNVDGTGRVDLSNNPAFDFGPTWSPDGRQIAFTSGRGSTPNDYDIIVMNADGSNQTNITSKSLADDLAPSWAH